MILAQSTPGSQHISPNQALYHHIELPKASHCIHCFLFVFEDVGLNGDMGKVGGKFAKISGEVFTAGQGKQGKIVENPGISYSDILILIPDSRAVYDLIFTLFILLALSR